jgi:hypothetical protein
VHSNWPTRTTPRISKWSVSSPSSERRPAIGAIPIAPLTTASPTAVTVTRTTPAGSSVRRRDQMKATCADSSATMAMMAVTRQKPSPSTSAHMPMLTSTKVAVAATTANEPSSGERSRTARPAAAIVLASANRVDVPMTFQSVSENSPPSSA